MLGHPSAWDDLLAPDPTSGPIDSLGCELGSSGQSTTYHLRSRRMAHNRYILNSIYTIGGLLFLWRLQDLPEFVGKALLALSHLLDETQDRFWRLVCAHVYTVYGHGIVALRSFFYRSRFLSTPMDDNL